MERLCSVKVLIIDILQRPLTCMAPMNIPLVDSVTCPSSYNITNNRNLLFTRCVLFKFYLDTGNQPTGEACRSIEFLGSESVYSYELIQVINGANTIVLPVRLDFVLRRPFRIGIDLGRGHLRFDQKTKNQCHDRHRCYHRCLKPGQLTLEPITLIDSRHLMYECEHRYLVLRPSYYFELVNESALRRLWTLLCNFTQQHYIPKSCKHKYL